MYGGGPDAAVDEARQGGVVEHPVGIANDGPVCQFEARHGAVVGDRAGELQMRAKKLVHAHVFQLELVAADDGMGVNAVGGLAAVEHVVDRGLEVQYRRRRLVTCRRRDRRCSGHRH